MKYVIRLLSILLLLAIALTACQNKSKKAKFQALNEVKSEGIITVDGIDLHYKIEGTGTPIIVLNGAMYIPMFSKKIKEKCQLIFVETRCFIPIETPSNLGSWTIETYVDDIETIRKELKLEKVAVLGHSAFGFLPLEYAIKYPNSISHAIVIGTPPFMNNRYAEEVKKYWETQASEERKIAFQKSTKELEEKNKSGIERTPLQIWVDNYIANAPKFWYDWNYDAAWIFDKAKGINMDVANNYYGKIMNEYDPSIRYNEIKCPVFIANGKYDFWAVPSLWESVDNKIAKLSNNVFQKSGHWAMIEEQELFDSKLLKWIAEN